MNHIRLLSLASLLVLLAACSKAPQEPVTASAPTPKSAAASTPTFEPSAGPVETPVARAIVTPDKGWYLTQRISLATTDGIMSLPAGTRVMRIGDDAGGIKVRAPDGTELIVQSDQITQDSSAGALYLQADADAKRRLANAQAAALRDLAARQAQQAKAAPGFNPQSNQGPATPSWTSSLDQGAYDQQKDPFEAEDAGEEDGEEKIKAARLRIGKRVFYGVLWRVTYQRQITQYQQETVQVTAAFPRREGQNRYLSAPGERFLRKPLGIAKHHAHPHSPEING